MMMSVVEFLRQCLEFVLHDCQQLVHRLGHRLRLVAENFQRGNQTDERFLAGIIRDERRLAVGIARARTIRMITERAANRHHHVFAADDQADGRRAGRLVHRIRHHVRADFARIGADERSAPRVVHDVRHARIPARVWRFPFAKPVRRCILVAVAVTDAVVTERGKRRDGCRVACGGFFNARQGFLRVVFASSTAGCCLMP